MEEMILNFIRTHFKALLVIGATLGSVLFIQFQHYELADLTTELAQCRKEAQGMEFSNAALVASLSEQNKAIAALREKALEKQRRAQAALDDIKKHAQSYASQAQQIHMIIPDADECRQLQSVLRQYTQPTKWR